MKFGSDIYSILPSGWTLKKRVLLTFCLIPASGLKYQFIHVWNNIFMTFPLDSVFLLLLFSLSFSQRHIDQQLNMGLFMWACGNVL